MFHCVKETFKEIYLNMFVQKTIWHAIGEGFSYVIVFDMKIVHWMQAHIKSTF